MTVTGPQSKPLEHASARSEPARPRRAQWLFGWVRRLYDWVLHWADTPYGAPALFLLAFAESSFFPIPPDVLLIALAVAAPTRAFRYALICTVGSVLGGMAGYGIGYFLWDTAGVSQLFYDYVPGFTPAVYEKVAASYAENGFLVVFLAGFTPIPFKVFTIAGGVCKIDLAMFALAAAVGRAGRFFLVAALFYFFGAPIKRWVDRYFEILVVVFSVLLVGGFVLIKYVL